jgi:hypothetical protein
MVNTTTTVEWKCLNESCSYEFVKPPMTLEEFKRDTWRHCPQCGASSRAVSIHSLEGTFYKSGIGTPL